jgi:hypothetical protein
MSPIAKRSNVPQLADQDIEANEVAQALLAAQYRWQAKQRDLEAKFCTDGRALRDAFLAEVASTRRHNDPPRTRRHRRDAARQCGARGR